MANLDIEFKTVQFDLDFKTVQFDLDFKDRGPKGAPGEGVPQGGDAGDVLIKGSDDDYDFEWKERQYTHEQAVPSDTWEIEHGMGFKPFVLIMNSAGERVYGWEEHPTINKVILKWDAAFSGTAYLS